MRRWLAGAVIIASAAGGGTACSGTSSSVEGQSCAEGKGTWMEDRSTQFDDGDGWTREVTVRLCVDDGGNVVDLEVE